MAWALRHDGRELLVPVPIQSALGAELLADAAPSERLRSAHVVQADGRRLSGGAAAADVFGALPQTRALGRIAGELPRTTALLYGVVAARRQSFGRFVGKEARRRADALLEASRVTTSAELESGSRSVTE
jgi:predicted DCC family thiol-disulfide oxidoreductase YuxK